VLLTGDEIFLYDNLKKNIPIGIAEDMEIARASLDRIRKLADIILPGHEPRVLQEFPEGVIG